MPIDYVSVNIGQRLGAKLRQTMDLLMMGRDNLVDLDNSIQRMNNGVDYTVVETQFGIPVGNGKLLADAIHQLVIDLAASTLPALLSRLG